MTKKIASQKKWQGWDDLRREKLLHWKKLSTKAKIGFLEESLHFVKFEKQRKSKMT